MTSTDRRPRARATSTAPTAWSSVAGARATTRPRCATSRSTQKTRAKRRVLDVVDRGLMDLVSVYRDAITVQLGRVDGLVNEEQRPARARAGPRVDAGGQPGPDRGGLHGPRADARVQRAAAAGAGVDDDGAAHQRLTAACRSDVEEVPALLAVRREARAAQDRSRRVDPSLDQRGGRAVLAGPRRPRGGHRPVDAAAPRLRQRGPAPQPGPPVDERDAAPHPPGCRRGSRPRSCRSRPAPVPPRAPARPRTPSRRGGCRRRRSSARGASPRASRGRRPGARRPPSEEPPSRPADGPGPAAPR